MPTPKLLTEDYTIAAVWADGNTSEEDRVGYFVSKDSSTSGVTINKANTSSEILGVTILADVPSYTSAKVGILGIVTVRDNGQCVANAKCKPSDAGIAVPSDTGYQVIDRVDDNHIRILFENKGKVQSSVINGVLHIGG